MSNSCAFAVAGITVSAGGPAAIMNGAIISQKPSGTLIVGKEAIKHSR